MYNIGDTVLYGGEGLCKVIGIEDKKIADKVIKYYALTPLDGKSSVFYVPTEGKVAETKLRQIISGKEIKDIVKNTVASEFVENDRARREVYSNAINSADRSAIVGFIKSCEIRENELLEYGKRLHKVDEYFIMDAEKFLYGEFKTVFKIEREQVIPFVLGKFEPEEL